MPHASVHVYETSGGCRNNHRATVKTTSDNNECLLAVNAGFFQPKNGQCLGKIIRLSI